MLVSWRSIENSIDEPVLGNGVKFVLAGNEIETYITASHAVESSRMNTGFAFPAVKHNDGKKYVLVQTKYQGPKTEWSYDQGRWVHYHVYLVAYAPVE